MQFRIGEEYEKRLHGHPLHAELVLAEEMYEALSSLSASHITRTRSLMWNLDSYFFESLSETLSSVRILTLAGRVADAYTLLRRFHETGWLQVFIMLRLDDASKRAGEWLLADDESDDVPPDFWAEDVESWLSGTKTLPDIARATQYIEATEIGAKLKTLFPNIQLKEVTDRCNDHVHVNFFKHLLRNAPQANWQDHEAWLNQLTSDFRDLLTRHLAHVFAIRFTYLGSSDYLDHLECNLEPIEDSQYWVAPVIQEVFDKIITPHRPDVRDFVRNAGPMHLT